MLVLFISVNKDLIMVLSFNSKYPDINANRNEHLDVCDFSLSHVLATSDSLISEEKISGKSNDGQQQLCSKEAHMMACTIFFLSGCRNFPCWHEGRSTELQIFYLSNSSYKECFF